MPKKTLKEQTVDIEQHGAMPEPGYSYNPRREPKLFKTPDTPQKATVANEPRIVDVAPVDGADEDADA